MTTYIGNAYDNNTNPIGLCLGQISPCAKDASACVADFGGCVTNVSGCISDVSIALNSAFTFAEELWFVAQKDK